MAKTALVTGGAGYIGSHLCEQLVAQNYKVIAYDNLFVGRLSNLDSLKDNKKFSFVKADVRNKSKLSENIKNADIVFHLAAIVGVETVVANPLENISVNVTGIQNVAELAQKYKKKLVFTSSSEVYGKNSEVPLQELDSLCIYGQTNVNRWAYGLAKALGEHLLWGYKEKGLEFAIVRYFNSYGPRGINSKYQNVIPKFIDQALHNKPITVHGDGSDTRCFCFVDDTVNGTILAGEKLNHDVVNIGSDNEITIKQLAKLIIKLTDSKSEIKYIKQEKVFNKPYESSKRRVPDISKSKKIGFTAKVNLEEGLARTIEWTKSQQSNTI